MGEYIKLHGEPTKLGTCEDLYYCTFQALQHWAGIADRVPGNLEPREYLNPKWGFRYRFPFPDEDNMGIGSHDAFNRGLLLPCINKDAPIVLAPREHDYHRVSINCNGTHNVNVRVPCPASGNLTHHSPIPSTVPVELVQQKQVDGNLVPVLRCGWCGSKYRITIDESRWLFNHLIHNEGGNSKLWHEIAARIAAGYQTSKAE